MASTPPPSSSPPAPPGRRAPVKLIGAAIAAALALGAFAIVTLAPGGSPAPARAAAAKAPLTAAEYKRLATAACKPGAAEPAQDEWIPILTEMTAAHEALTPPAELAKVHAELVRTDKVLLDVFRKIKAGGGGQKVVRKYFPTEVKAISDREKLKSALPGCA